MEIPQKHLQDARKWFELRHKVSDSSLDYRVLPKHSQIIQDFFIGAFVTIAILAIIIWLVNSENSLDLRQLPKSSNSTNISKIPALVWYSSDVWCFPINRQIRCQNGSRIFECELFRKQTQPEEPEAYLFDAAEMDNLPLPRDSKTIWGVFHEESPLIRLTFMHEEGLNLFNFSATFSRFSDLPVPLIWMKNIEAVTSPLYFVNTSTKNSFLSELAPVMYLQSDCNTSTDRDAYVQKLMKHIQIDSYGACLRNKPLPLHGIYSNEGFYKYMQHLYGQELLKFMARYKFMVTIENSVCNDYVTEKLWRAIEVGTVPIYYGSPLIRDWLPNNKSAILLEDFPTPELLSQHLHYLLQNDTAYEEYLEHKTLGVISNRRLIEEVVARPYQTDLQTARKKFECFICEKVHKRNNADVNMVTKKHYDCPPPSSALTLSVNLSSSWVERIRRAKIKIDSLREEIRMSNRTQHSSKISFDFND